MSADLPQIPINTPTLVSPPGGWIDLSSIPSGTSKKVLVEDLSSLGYSVQIVPMARYSSASNSFQRDNDPSTLFAGPVPVLVDLVTGGTTFYQNRLYLIFIGYTRPRAINVTLV